jgi:hypothetical protein
VTVAVTPSSSPATATRHWPPRSALTQVEDELFAPLDADQRETLYELLLEVTGGQLPSCASAAADDGEPE